VESSQLNLTNRPDKLLQPSSSFKLHILNEIAIVKA